MADSRGIAHMRSCMCSYRRTTSTCSDVRTYVCAAIQHTLVNGLLRLGGSAHDPLCANRPSPHSQLYHSHSMHAHTHTGTHARTHTHTHTHTGERQTWNGSACVYQYNLQFFTYYRKMAETQVLLKDWPLHRVLRAPQRVGPLVIRTMVQR